MIVNLKVLLIISPSTGKNAKKHPNRIMNYGFNPDN